MIGGEDPLDLSPTNMENISWMLMNVLAIRKLMTYLE
jgi:hypothetical protein